MLLENVSDELIKEILKSHPTLESLNLSSNQIYDLNFLNKLPILKKLDVSSNQIRYLPSDFVLYSHQLVILNLNHNCIKDLEPLRACTSLTQLHIAYNAVSSFDQFYHLRNLRSLEVLAAHDNPIAQVEQSYRNKIVQVLAQLRNLDNKEITSNERLAARISSRSLIGAEECVTTQESLDRQNQLIGTKTALKLKERRNNLSINTFTAKERERGLLTPSSLVGVDSSVLSLRSNSSWRSNLEIKHNNAMDDESRASIYCKQSKSSAYTESDPSTHLLQCRISALESMLSIQEGYLSKEFISSTIALGDRTHGNAQNDKSQYIQLLNAWRKKVFDLLVEAKQRELLENVTEHKRNEEVYKLQNELVILQEQIKTWKQKVLDYSAQKDLEKLQLRSIQYERERGEQKLSRTVRSLASERTKVEILAHSVENFCSRHGPLSCSMKRVHDASLQIVTYEIRMKALQDRIKVAALLMSHRHAWYRNNEAAMEVQWRISPRRTLISSSAEYNCADREIRKLQPFMSKSKRLRSGLQKAIRAVFDSLDTRKTGSISCAAFLSALGSDDGVMVAIGDDRRREEFVNLLATHLCRNTITWGELMLLFVPKCNDGPDTFTTHPGRTTAISSSKTYQQNQQQFTPILRVWKTAELKKFTRGMLYDLIRTLQQDRDMLRERVQCDAFQLSDRVQQIQTEWELELDTLSKQNGLLKKDIKQFTLNNIKVEKQIMCLEDAFSSLLAQSSSYKTRLEQAYSAHQSMIEQLQAEKTKCVEHEQELWQKEVRDMTFQTRQIQQENHQLRKKLRQLEHDITRLNSDMAKSESKEVLELKGKLCRRDKELAKVRKERNGLLASLREQKTNTIATLTSDAQVQTEALKLVGVKIGSTQTTPVCQIWEEPITCNVRKMKAPQLSPQSSCCDQLGRLEMIAKELLEEE